MRESPNFGIELGNPSPGIGLHVVWEEIDGNRSVRSNVV